MIFNCTRKNFYYTLDRCFIGAILITGGGSVSLPKRRRCYRRNSTMQEPTTEGSIDPEAARTGKTLEKGF